MSDDPLQLVYAIATYIRLGVADQQRILELDSTNEKLRLLMNILNKELEVLELAARFRLRRSQKLRRSSANIILREQLKAIQKELGEGDEQTVEVEEFREKIEAAKMPDEARREANRELDRFHGCRLPQPSTA